MLLNRRRHPVRLRLRRPPLLRQLWPPKMQEPHPSTQRLMSRPPPLQHVHKREIPSPPAFAAPDPALSARPANKSPRSDLPPRRARAGPKSGGRTNRCRFLRRGPRRRLLSRTTRGMRKSWGRREEGAKAQEETEAREPEQRAEGNQAAPWNTSLPFSSLPSLRAPHSRELAEEADRLHLRDPCMRAGAT